MSGEDLAIVFVILGALVALVSFWPPGPRSERTETDAEVYGAETPATDAAQPTTCADVNDGRACVVCQSDDERRTWHPEAFDATAADPTMRDPSSWGSE